MTPHAPPAGWVRRRRGTGSDTVLIGVGVAAFAHLLLLAGIEVLDLASPNMGTSRAKPAPARDAALAAATPLTPSCDGDAILHAAARAAWCATPFADDADACLTEVENRLRTDFLLCHIDTIDVMPPVDLVPQPAVAEIPQIDPEPLLEPLTPEELKQFQQQQQAVAAAEPPPPPPPPPPPQQRPPMQAQVIEAPKPANEEAPENARFLAEYDSKADKQKVARGDRFEDMIDKPKAPELEAKKDAREASQPDEPQDEVGKDPDAPPVPGALSMRKPGTPDRGEVAQDKKVAGVATDEVAAGDGPKKKRGDAAFDQQERKQGEIARGEGGGGGGTPRAPNLRPDDKTLERVVGGGSVDHVEDVEEGDENAFNTRRWVHASFFNRMKRQVAQNWNPADVWRREDPRGSTHGLKSRVTQVKVSLDPKGKIAKIIVIRPSGVQALDDEAVRAFMAAGPFPNPPQALVDRDGLISFEFGFHFTVDAKKTTWKFQRPL